MNMISPGARTLTHYNKKDLLHCVVAGHGEHFTLVSPYQRTGVEAGQETTFENDQGQREQVPCPPDFSHKLILDAVKPKDGPEADLLSP